MLYGKYQSQCLIRSGVNTIDKMTGLEFQDYLAVVFERLGYSVKKTPYNDYGADLILTDRSGIRTAVQAKHYGSNVGISAVQEVVAAKNYYHCESLLVVTNRDFTDPAKRLAQTNRVALWDRQILIRKSLLAQKGSYFPYSLLDWAASCIGYFSKMKNLIR